MKASGVGWPPKRHNPPLSSFDQVASIADTFWSRVDVSTDATACWPWRGQPHWKGYGQVCVRGSTRQAHRVAFLLAGGKLSPDLQLDHLCRNRLCCNPAHLEPVDNKTNLLRGQFRCSKGHVSWRRDVRGACPGCAEERRQRAREWKAKAPERAARRRAEAAARPLPSHCKHGHPADWWVGQQAGGSRLRICRGCQRARDRIRDPHRKRSRRKKQTPVAASSRQVSP